MDRAEEKGTLKQNTCPNHTLHPPITKNNSDLGCHIDGFIATQATTIQVSAAGLTTPITGRAADVVKAARAAFDVAIRLIRPGRKASDVGDKLARAVAPFGCSVVEGVMSHDMGKDVIDGARTVLNRPAADVRQEDFEFEPNEVYAIDIVVSTGEEGGAGQRAASFRIFLAVELMLFRHAHHPSRHINAQQNKTSYR